ncbi:MAG: nucleoside hydrolase [Candidatus Dormibacteraeota bacterium]|uniref:Nucleoside hydrolase n=1 Tax=Candidatus Dormiibacter inghamiae TaxID=3127013 RepID=A0A934KG78_9BACT|nr:nucleoside hydrolase [Candidatus Dormibacteraeota bacterium]MBJ7606050.1 nucleoside hydrolase [Candidatus Dormibacteraeota bacterium]
MPVLLDCDTGIDDALAILYLANSGLCDLVAVGSVHGNVTALTGARNTIRVLDVAGLSGIPVVVGADRPLAQPVDISAHIHGDDGLGNTSQPVPSAEPTQGEAAQQIIRLARERPGELTLLAIGPLTNLGLALLLDPDLPKLIPHVVVMGGAAVAPGNVTTHAEANIWHDPEAADLVFTAGWPVTMVGLDVTMKALLSEADQKRIEHSQRDTARFCWDILQFYLDRYQEFMGLRTCALHDPLAAGIALDRSFATYRKTQLRVELRGERTRGMTVADLRPGRQAEGPVELALEVDAEAFRERFLDTIC